MKITIEKLEQILADECDKIDELRTFRSVSPDVYALLYMTAKTGEIGIVDALYSARRCVTLVRFLIDKFLTADDKPDIEALSLVLWFSRTRTDPDEQLVSAMQGWAIRQRENRLPG